MAQSSHGVSASRSDASIVAPAQIRSPGGKRLGRHLHHTRCPRRLIERRYILRPWLGYHRQDPRNHGATILMHTEVLEIVPDQWPENQHSWNFPPIGTQTDRFASDRAISVFNPPILSAQVRPSRASSTHSIEGVLMVAALNTPSMSFPQPEVKRKILGMGQAGVWLSSRSTARGPRIRMPCCAPLLPSTFARSKLPRRAYPTASPSQKLLMWHRRLSGLPGRPKSNHRWVP